MSVDDLTRARAPPRTVRPPPRRCAPPGWSCTSSCRSSRSAWLFPIALGGADLAARLRLHRQRTATSPSAAGPSTTTSHAWQTGRLRQALPQLGLHHRARRCCSPCSWPPAWRSCWPGSAGSSTSSLLGLFTAANLLPQQALLIPLFRLFTEVPLPEWMSDSELLYDSYWGLILVNVAFQIGFCVFVLSNYMKTLPHELYEAAMVDGASVWRQYWQVTMPLCRPALAALATLEVTWIYNEFFWATVLMRTGDKFPVTSSLNNLRGEFFTDNNLVAAGVGAGRDPHAGHLLPAAEAVRLGADAGRHQGHDRDARPPAPRAGAQPGARRARPGLPRVVHWGADLGPLRADDLPASSTPPSAGRAEQLRRADRAVPAAGRAPAGAAGPGWPGTADGAADVFAPAARSTGPGGRRRGRRRAGGRPCGAAADRGRRGRDRRPSRARPRRRC